MGIRIMGMPDTSHLAQVAAVRYKDSLIEGRTACEGDFFSSKAFLGFYGPSRCNKPYLCLLGTVGRVRGEFPQNITEITLDEPVPAAFLYDFSREELADLCRKGLFDPGFKCPDIFENNEWQGLPIPACRYSMIPGDEESAPVIFVGIEKAFDLPLDKDCGYIAGSYFEMAAEQQAQYEDDDYTDRSRGAEEPEDGHEPDYEQPRPDPATVDKALRQVDSLEDMTNSVIMSNPQLRAAYESMQASVQAKLSGQAARQEDAGEEEEPEAVEPVDGLEDYEPEEAREEMAQPAAAPEARREIRPIPKAGSSGPDNEYE